jgi:coenzyme F420 hydrogenase subunit delta
MIKEMLTSSVLIFGCGNPLFGDDGFGPAVVERLKGGEPLPEGVWAEDVGTSACDLLFDILLAQEKPRAIVIVDAVSQLGRRPGELFELPISGIPGNKSVDFSLHQFPSVNLLEELTDEGAVAVRILAAQVVTMPDHVRPGLSPAMASAVGMADAWLRREAMALAA